MPFDALTRLVVIEDVFEDDPFLCRHRRIHQPRHRTLQDFGALPAYLQTHQDGDNRINPFDTGNNRHADPHDHTDRRPDSGHEVMPIRLQGDGTVFLSGAN